MMVTELMDTDLYRGLQVGTASRCCCECGVWRR